MTNSSTAHYRITHITRYRYDAPASLCYNEVRMLPRTFRHPLFQQQCTESQVIVEPAWGDHRDRTDFFGNRVLYYAIRQPHEVMSITVVSQVQIVPQPGSQAASLADEVRATAAQGPPWEHVRRQLHEDRTSVDMEARQFCMASPMIPTLPEVAKFAARSFPAGRPLVASILHLMARIYHDFDFVSGATTVATPLHEVLHKRRGVCQDFTHLMVACLRSQGLAARYVSGYIETLPPSGQERLQGTDASHAWCSVYVPDVGWLDFDPTNNLIPTDQHIVVGWGRDFGDVTPLKGVFFGDGKHELDVSVDVERQS